MAEIKYRVKTMQKQTAEDRFIRCERKKGYSFPMARRIAKRMRRQDHEPITEYFCRDCKKWHVGHNGDGR